jgi:hypothetical protein
MHAVATLPQNYLDTLAKQVGEITMPSHIQTVFGPKLISRPADLSPGEYETVMHVYMPMLAPTDCIGLDEAAKQRWLGLCVAQTNLWNA